jgi:hypothetical protein
MVFGVFERIDFWEGILCRQLDKSTFNWLLVIIEGSFFSHAVGF